MGLDLATILGVLGTVWVGNPISLTPGFSIGGPTHLSENILHDLLGLVGMRRTNFQCLLNSIVDYSCQAPRKV